MSDALEQMRLVAREKAAAGPKRRKKAWEPPDPARFRHGLVLSFDQTLTNTGVALVQSGYEGLSVLFAQSLRVDTEETSFEATYDKAFKMGAKIERTMFIQASASPGAIVHEMPSVQGHRVESALIGGYLVRHAAKTYARGVPLAAVSNRAMRALLNAPEERFEKRHVREAVEALIPPERRTGRLILNWNEHVHDAVALAATHLYERETP